MLQKPLLALLLVKYNSLSADLEADLDAESSKGLNELKESAPKLEPEAVQRTSIEQEEQRVIMQLE